MLHGDRNAMIYGGGGSIGGAVARALAAPAGRGVGDAGHPGRDPPHRRHPGVAADDMPGRDAIVETMAAPTTLGRTATLEDVGNVAAFVASDWARTLTAAAVNISCGALVD